MEQPTEDQPELEQDKLELNSNELGTQEDIEVGTPSSIGSHPPAIKGSEEITIRYNGCELNLSSSMVRIDGLTEIAYSLYQLLKDGKPLTNGGKYLG